jgi:RNA polymerase sigma factor (sigma-70 family)
MAAPTTDSWETSMQNGEWQSWPNARWIQGANGEDQEAQEQIIKLLYAWTTTLRFRFPNLDFDEFQQRAVLAAWKIIAAKHGQFRGPGSFRGWMRAILNNVVKREGEQLARPQQHLDWLDDIPEITLSELTTSVPELLTPLQQRRIDSLQDCRDGLDERDRAVIDSLLADGDNGLLAQEQGVTRTYLNKLRERALKKLRSCMEAKGLGYD